MTAPLTASTSQTETGTCVVLEGELDLATVDEAAAALDSAFDIADSVTLDLRGLEFIDSSGLALITKTVIAARGSEREFTVIPGVKTLRLLELTGLSSLIRLADAETPG